MHKHLMLNEITFNLAATYYLDSALYYKYKTCTVVIWNYNWPYIMHNVWCFLIMIDTVTVRKIFCLLVQTILNNLHITLHCSCLISSQIGIRYTSNWRDSREAWQICGPSFRDDTIALRIWKCYDPHCSSWVCWVWQTLIILRFTTECTARLFIK